MSKHLVFYLGLLCIFFGWIVFITNNPPVYLSGLLILFLGYIFVLMHQDRLSMRLHDLRFQIIHTQLEELEKKKK